MASDLPASQTLSDDELAAQITTFLLAGTFQSVTNSLYESGSDIPPLLIRTGFET